MSVAQTERLAYIDFRLMFLGEISRQDLIERFEISEPAATRDLSEYKEKSPGNLEYSHSERTYLVGESFRPLFEHTGRDALTTLTHGHLAIPKQRPKSLLRSDLPIEIDNPDPWVVSVITRAINRHRVVTIDYRSHSSGQTRRDIVPFAVVNNGLRWHIRAYDRMRERFTDFVIARISDPSISSSVPEEREHWENDIQWNRIVELELVPHPARNHTGTSEFEYGMQNGFLKLKLRAAVAGYFLRRWNIDCSKDHSLVGNEYQLWLRNREALYGVETLEIAPGYDVA